MGFYSVTLTLKDEESEEISILFPSSIVKNLFPVAKEFTPLELLNTIAEAVRKCTERLTETGYTEALVPMANDCQMAATRVALLASPPGGVKKILKVVASSDYFEDLKRLSEQ